MQSFTKYARDILLRPMVHTRSFGSLSLAHTRSFGLLGLCKEAQKTKGQSLFPLSFGPFCTTLRPITHTTLCELGLIGRPKNEELTLWVFVFWVIWYDPKARRAWRRKCSAKWHECHFAQQNSRRVRMIFAEEVLICATEENIYHV